MPPLPEEAKRLHGTILVEIDNYIGNRTHEFRLFKTMVESIRKSAEILECECMLQILGILEKNGDISVGNYEYIFKTFEDIGYNNKELLSIIEEKQLIINVIISQADQANEENIGGATVDPVFSEKGDQSFISERGSLPENDPENWYLDLPPKLRIEFYDVVIVYHESDRQKATAFKEHLMTIHLNCEKKVKAILYDEILPNSRSSKTGGLEDAIDRSTYIFFFGTKMFIRDRDDKWLELLKAECVMETIYNPEKQECSRFIIGEDLSGEKPQIGFLSMGRLNYILKDDFYVTSIRTILENRMCIREQKETKLRLKTRKFCLEKTEKCISIPPQMQQMSHQSVNSPTSQQGVTSETLSLSLINSEHDRKSKDNDVALVDTHSVCNTSTVDEADNVRESNTRKGGNTENNTENRLQQSGITDGSVIEENIPDHQQEPDQSHQGTSEDVESVLKEQIKERDGPMTNTCCVNITNVCCSGSRCTQFCCTCNIA